MTPTLASPRSVTQRPDSHGLVPVAVCVPTPEGDLVHPLYAGATTVGGGPRCDLRLTGDLVRPLHCVITCQDGRATVRRWAPDTRLNGEEFTERSLEEGDCLTIGSIELVVVRHEEAPADDRCAGEEEPSQPSGEGDAAEGLIGGAEEEASPWPAEHAEQALCGAAPDATAPSEHAGGGWETDDYEAVGQASACDAQPVLDPTRPSATAAQRRRARALVHALRDARGAADQAREELAALEQGRQELLVRVTGLEDRVNAGEAAAAQFDAEREEWRRREQELQDGHAATIAEVEHLRLEQEARRQIAERLVALQEEQPLERARHEQELAQLRGEVDRLAAELSAATDRNQQCEDDGHLGALPRAETLPLGGWSDSGDAPADGALLGDEQGAADIPVEEGDDASGDVELDAPTQTMPMPSFSDGDWDESSVDDSPSQEGRSDVGPPPRPETHDADGAATATAAPETATLELGAHALSEEALEEDPPAWLAESPAEEACEHDDVTESSEFCESVPDGPLPGDAHPADAPTEAIAGEQESFIETQVAPTSDAPASFYEQHAHLLPSDDAGDSVAANGTGQQAGPLPASNPAEPAVGEEDDIEAYMAQLMRRMRGENGDAPLPAAPVSAPTRAPAKPEPSESAEAVSPAAPTVRLTSLDELKRNPGPEQNADMRSMRDLANQSARDAIGAATSRYAMEKAIANLVIAVIAVASGGFLIASAPAIYSVQLVSGAFASLLAGVLGYRSLSLLLTASRASVKRGAAPPAPSEPGELPIAAAAEDAGAATPHPPAGDQQS